MGLRATDSALPAERCCRARGPACGGGPPPAQAAGAPASYFRATEWYRTSWTASQRHTGAPLYTSGRCLVGAGPGQERHQTSSELCVDVRPAGHAWVGVGMLRLQGVRRAGRNLALVRAPPPSTAPCPMQALKARVRVRRQTGARVFFRGVGQRVPGVWASKTPSAGVSGVCRPRPGVGTGSEGCPALGAIRRRGCSRRGSPAVLL